MSSFKASDTTETEDQSDGRVKVIKSRTLEATGFHDRNSHRHALTLDEMAEFVIRAQAEGAPPETPVAAYGLGRDCERLEATWVVSTEYRRRY